MINFGAGVLIATRSDISGQSPEPFGVLQGVDLAFDFTEKQLMGALQHPIMIARAEAKFTAKAKAASINGRLLNNIFFGMSLATGSTQLAANEAATVPATSPYVVTPANSATWTKDEGVSYSGPLGVPFTVSSGAPGAAGVYEASASAYTFSSSDASKQVVLNYLYTLTTGESIAITNQALGTTPTFAGVFRNRDPNTGLFLTFAFNKATSSKLSLSSKLSDFSIPEFDISFMDDGTGNIGTLSWGDAA